MATFRTPVVFSAEVTFSETPAEISLDNLASLTGSGTFTAADLVATDDVTVGDDLTVTGLCTIGETLGVTGASTLAAVACTTLAASSNATVGGTLGVTGTSTMAAINASGTVAAAGAMTVGTTLGIGTGASIGGAGSGTAAADLTLNKTAAGVADVLMKAANVLRGSLALDASENMVLSVFDGSEALLGAITLNNSTGAITLSKGTTITTGGLTVTAGGITVSSGALALALASVGNYADDAAAAVGSVPVGGVYRTGSALKIRAA